MSNDPNSRTILVLNAGSSSVKFALYGSAGIVRVLAGKIDRIGLPGTLLTLQDEHGKESHEVQAIDHAACSPMLRDLLQKRSLFSSIVAVSHRIVHGGPRFSEPQLITPGMLTELRDLTPYAPDHLPGEIALIESISQQMSGCTQVACFDTSFHRDMPGVAKRLALPRRYFNQGIRKYGFHGISYSYLMDELKRLDSNAAKGRIIFAHLGNGASMAAVKDGYCMDTTMGFTPAGGLIMGTRSGDLDPGLDCYFARTERLSAEMFDTMINKESGLLGLSETSSDVRDLLKIEDSDIRAKEALESFCYHARKWIGALSATLGGLDTLVFSGGIGENAAVIRERICSGLCYLGIELCEERNKLSEPIISSDNIPVTVRVIKTDEELWMAARTADLIK